MASFQLDVLPLDVRVVSDVICPWCYLGTERLSKALQLLQKEFPTQISISQRWIPYLLNPGLSSEKIVSKRRMYEKKFNGDLFKVKKMERSIAKLYLAEGLPKYTLDGNCGSTLNAHRLMELVKDVGLQTQLMNVLFRKYHTEGKSPSVQKHLIDSAIEAGLKKSKEELIEFLESNEKLNEVAGFLQTNTHVFPMLSGVPHFRFSCPSKEDKTMLIHSVIPGAQDLDTFILSLSNFLTRAGYETEVKAFKTTISNDTLCNFNSKI